MYIYIYIFIYVCVQSADVLFALPQLISEARNEYIYIYIYILELTQDQPWVNPFLYGEILDL